MSYTNIEGALQTISQTLTSYFAVAAQVTRGDYGVLDAGYDYALVLYPGAYADTGYWANNTIAREWTVHADLFQRVAGDDAGALQTFIALREAWLDTIHAYPRLNNLSGVQSVNAVRGDEPAWLFDDSNNGPFFIKQTFTLTVTELVTVTALG